MKYSTWDHFHNEIESIRGGYMGYIYQKLRNSFNKVKHNTYSDAGQNPFNSF